MPLIEMCTLLLSEEAFARGKCTSLVQVVPPDTWHVVGHISCVYRLPCNVHLRAPACIAGQSGLLINIIKMICLDLYFGDEVPMMVFCGN